MSLDILHKNWTHIAKKPSRRAKTHLVPPGTTHPRQSIAFNKLAAEKAVNLLAIQYLHEPSKLSTNTEELPIHLHLFP